MNVSIFFFFFIHIFLHSLLTSITPFHHLFSFFPFIFTSFCQPSLTPFYSLFHVYLPLYRHYNCYLGCVDRKLYLDINVLVSFPMQSREKDSFLITFDRFYRSIRKITIVLNSHFLLFFYSFTSRHS